MIQRLYFEHVFLPEKITEQNNNFYFDFYFENSI